MFSISKYNKNLATKLKAFSFDRNALILSFKITAMIIFIPILIYVVYNIFDRDSYLDYFISFVMIWFSAAYILYPFLADYTKLSEYVKHLSLGRVVSLPDLKSYAAISELSDSLRLLNTTWENRQRELLEKVNETKLLLKALPGVLFILDEYLRVIRCNLIAEKVFNFDITGYSFEEIIDNKTLLGALRIALHDQTSKKLDVKWLNKEYEAIIEAYDNKHGSGKNLILMMHDITDKKRTEAMLVDFISNASHEIRTPLTAIIGMIETLESSGWKDEEAMSIFIPMMIKQTHRMKALINDLLSLSSIERRINEPPTEHIDMKHVVEIVIKQLEWQLNKEKIKIIYTRSNDLPLVLGDFNQLGQVMENLLSNAIKYGGSNKSIFVDIKIENCMLSVSVTDQGEGMDKEHLDRLTERFYRVDKSRSSKISGTGLGLAIVKQIILRHRGELKIESTVGKGSKFTIYLPCEIE